MRNTWPQNWKVTELQNMALAVTGCPYHAWEYPEDNLNEVTVIESVDLDTFNLSDLKYMKITEREILKYRFKKGDLIFCSKNSPKQLGKTFIFDLNETVLHTTNFIRIRPLEGVDSRFLKHVLDVYREMGVFNHLASHFNNLHSLSLFRLKNLKVPFPTADQQKDFMEALENGYELSAAMV